MNDQATLRQLLTEIIRVRAADGESLAVVGRVLAGIIGGGRAPLSRQYVQMLASGKTRITEEIGRAIETLAAMHDGVAEVQARARPVETPVLAVYDLPAYTVIMRPARRCALAGCRIWFVGAPAQKYCGADCRREAARRRRAEVGR